MIARRVPLRVFVQVILSEQPVMPALFYSKCRKFEPFRGR